MSDMSRRVLDMNRYFGAELKADALLLTKYATFSSPTLPDPPLTFNVDTLLDLISHFDLITSYLTFRSPTTWDT